MSIIKLLKSKSKPKSFFDVLNDLKRKFDVVETLPSNPCYKPGSKPKVEISNKGMSLNERLYLSSLDKSFSKKDLPGCRRYLTKSGDVISIKSTDDGLQIINETALSKVKEGKPLKKGSFIAMVKEYINKCYPNWNKGEGRVFLDRNITRYTYNKGAKTRFDDMNLTNVEKHQRVFNRERSLPQQKADQMGIKYQLINGGWQTPLNTALNK